MQRQIETMMPINDTLLEPAQPALFPYLEVSNGAVELFPAVWSASEGLIDPDSHVRRAALQRLQELGAVRLSPLAAYLAATRLTDPDLPLRSQAVRLVGGLFQPDASGRAAPEGVRRHVVGYISQMRTRSVYCLLEVVIYHPTLEDDVFHLLRSAPYAGLHLADIATNRQVTLNIRQQAIRLVGRVGYVDAIAPLERLAARLEARRNGQQAMIFVPSGAASDESSLLPAVRQSLDMLKAP
jgi:hypothetical protein